MEKLIEMTNRQLASDMAMVSEHHLQSAHGEHDTFFWYGNHIFEVIVINGERIVVGSYASDEAYTGLHMENAVRIARE
jgi:hypothetical protein